MSPLLMLLCLSGGYTLAEPPLWGHLHPGHFAVGFRSVQQRDGITLHIWYPALPNSGTPLNLGDYLRLSSDLKGAVRGFETNETALRKTLAMIMAGGSGEPSETQFTEILRTTSAAARNAHPAAGRFPLVFWTHRYATTSLQSVLNEYVASYGFVVVYAAAKTPPQLPSEFKTPHQKTLELKRQIQRLRTALSRARALPGVESQKVAIIAWNYAGESARMLQAFEPDVKAVIGLSSNVLDRPEYETESRVEPRPITVPYILIDGNHRPELAMENAHSRIFLVQIAAMLDSSFDIFHGMVPSIFGSQLAVSQSQINSEQQLGYEVAAQYVLRTLEHYLYAVPTLDTPFRLWEADGVKEGFVKVKEEGTAPEIPQQPKALAVHFTSSAGLEVAADLYTTGNHQAPTIVLTHQSASSRGEYRQIAPHLLRLGFNSLAVDTRWGNRDFWNGVVNETAERYGTAAILESGDVKKMRPVQTASVEDIRAGLRWLSENGYTGAKLLWGSSISANIALKLAAENQDDVTAVVGSSPGEYHADAPNEVRSAIGALSIPVLITAGVDEEENSRPIFDALPAGNKYYYRALRGRHGSSILLDDPANWAGVESFLKNFVESRNKSVDR